MFRLILLGVVALVAWLSYQRFYAPKAQAPITEPAPLVEERVIRPPSIQRDWPAPAPAAIATPAAANSPPPAAAIEPQFKCDGRVYCSQMKSCAEAKFFQSHCPGVKMDNNGKGNGVPCERQWCTNG